MERASYRHGIRWIAFGDEPECLDPDEMRTLISVCLLADLFGVTSDKVAADVIRARKKSIEEENKAR